MTVFGRFPYPVTVTFIQISVTTLFFYGLSCLCSLVPWERLQYSIKLFSQPSSNSEEIESLWPITDVTPSDWEPFRRTPLAHPEIPKTANDFRTDWRDVVEVLPLAVAFLLKLVLENIFIACVLYSLMIAPSHLTGQLFLGARNLLHTFFFESA